MLLVGLLSIAACDSPPIKEMSEAKAAVERARTAGAERYASTEYQAAQAALRRSNESVSQRDYRQALAFALDSRELAQTALHVAGEQKAVARDTTMRAIRTLEQSIAGARQQIEAVQVPARAPKTRADRLHVSDLRRAIVVANVALQKARAAVAEDDYPGANQALAGAAERLRAVVETKTADSGAAAPAATR